MVGPSRAMSAQVLLTVGPDHLVLDPPEAEPLEIGFDPTVFAVDRGSDETRPGSLEARGQALWNAALSGPLSSALDRAAARAHSRGLSLTLRVLTAPNLDPQLRWLPWELLFDPGRRDFLALKSGWSLVRGMGPSRRRRDMPPRAPRVLVLVTTAPEDGGPATAAEQITSIRDAAHDPEDVHVVSDADPAAVLEHLARQSAEVVHVIGHCSDTRLTVSGQGRRPAGAVAGADLGRAIARNKRAALLVLSAGSGQGVAEEVARTVDVAVLGHRQPVPDRHAAGLTRSFYRNFLAGFPADVALTEARRYLDRQFPGERAWASAFLLTGWPPPSVPGADRAASSGGPAATTADDRTGAGAADIDAAALIEKLHDLNRTRVGQLLDVARWRPLEQQLDDATRWLAKARTARTARP